MKMLVEYSHRVSSGLSLAFVAGLFVWAFLLFPKKSFQRKAASFALLGIFLEAMVGAMLVLLRYVEHDQSTGRVFSIALHLVNTLFLTAALTLSAESASFGDKARFLQAGLPLRRWAIALIFAFALVGAFGALTALGDTLFRPETLEGGLRADWVEGAHITEKLRVFHPIFALVWAALLFPVSGRFLGETLFRRRASLLFLLVTANLLLGAANVILLAPVWLQIVHLAFANGIWIVFLGLLFSVSCGWREPSN